MPGKNRARQVALYGLLLALTLILGWVDSLIPLSGLLPGAKLGLANLVVLCGLYMLPEYQAAVLAEVKILITGLLFGNAYSILYSACGGVLSFLVMLLCEKTGRSMVFASVLGGISHNLGQILAGWLILGTGGIFAYLPGLLLVGFGAGAAVGAVGGIVVQRVQAARAQNR